jgi:hypothetical protein
MAAMPTFRGRPLTGQAEQDTGASPADEPTLPSTVVAVNGAVGQQPGSPFLVLSARGALALTGELPPSYSSQVKAGLPVTIYDEVTGIHATGKVAAIGTPTATAPAGTTVDIGGSGSGSSSSSSSSSSSGSGSSSSSTLLVPVTIPPSAPLPAALNGENVLVTVQTGRTEGPVLTVPVAAVVTTASGQTSVTVVGRGEADHRPGEAGAVGERVRPGDPDDGRDPGRRGRRGGQRMSRPAIELSQPASSGSLPGAWPASPRCSSAASRTRSSVCTAPRSAW